MAPTTTSLLDKVTLPSKAKLLYAKELPLCAFNEFTQAAWQSKMNSAKSDKYQFMPAPVILPAPRRSCEECLALRAKWSKPRHTPMRPPTVEQLLRELVATTRFSEKVWPRIGRNALSSGCPVTIREALTALQTEANRLKVQRQKLATLLPLLYA